MDHDRMSDTQVSSENDNIPTRTTPTRNNESTANNTEIMETTSPETHPQQQEKYLRMQNNPQNTEQNAQNAQNSQTSQNAQNAQNSHQMQFQQQNTHPPQNPQTSSSSQNIQYVQPHNPQNQFQSVQMMNINPKMRMPCLPVPIHPRTANLPTNVGVDRYSQGPRSSDRSRSSAPIFKLTVDLIHTYKRINELYYKAKQRSRERKAKQVVHLQPQTTTVRSKWKRVENLRVF